MTRAMFLVLVILGFIVYSPTLVRAEDSAVHTFDDQNGDGVSDGDVLAQQAEENSNPSTFEETGDPDPEVTDSDGSNTGE